MTLRKKAYRLYHRFMLDHFHHILVDQEWMKWKGYKVNWDNPRDINEKIQWLLCFSDTSKWSLCADKIKVKDYLKSKGLSDIAVPLIGVWDRAEDIDFDSLPDKFVIKCNHDSGSYHIIDKSVGFDERAVRSDLASHLKIKYGYERGEMYYNRITPRILAEEFIPPDDCSLTSAPVDYKIWCFRGRPYYIWACYGRTKEVTYVNIYDLDWNVHPEVSLITSHYRDGKGLVPRPKTLDRMLKAASILSEEFPEVRVDFYESGEQLYFGEMTFASNAAKMEYFTDEFMAELGSYCVLPQKR